MITRKFQNRLNSFFTYFILSLASLISLFPFYWMITGATNKAVDITSGKLLPGGELLNNFANLMKNTNITQAFFNTAKALIISKGILPFSWLILKFSVERCVCAPQYLSAGTSTYPMVSFSVLVFMVSFFLAKTQGRKGFLFILFYFFLYRVWYKNSRI